MTAFITKYALTSGISEVSDGKVSENCPSTLSAESLGLMACFHGEGKEWHRTRASAVAKAKQMRAATIKKLKKRIERLKVMNFDCKKVS